MVEQRHESHGGAVVPAALHGGPQKGDPYAGASTLCLPPNNPYCSGQNSPEIYWIWRLHNKIFSHTDEGTVAWKATYFISRSFRTQRIFGGQHGWRDHNTCKCHIAEVTVVAQPMTEHPDPGTSVNMKRKKNWNEIWHTRQASSQVKNNLCIKDVTTEYSKLPIFQALCMSSALQISCVFYLCVKSCICVNANTCKPDFHPSLLQKTMAFWDNSNMSVFHSSHT